MVAETGGGTGIDYTYPTTITYIEAQEWSKSYPVASVIIYIANYFKSVTNLHSIISLVGGGGGGGGVLA